MIRHRREGDPTHLWASYVDAEVHAVDTWPTEADAIRAALSDSDGDTWHETGVYHRTEPGGHWLRADGFDIDCLIDVEDVGDAGIACTCCGMRHGRPLHPGEHCDWCDRPTDHPLAPLPSCPLCATGHGVHNHPEKG